MHTVNRRVMGFSMIEVLVTILLICVGVLGMVALQSRSVEYAQDSSERGTAMALADDLMEMMRLRTNSVNPVIPAGYLKADGTDFPAVSASGCSNTVTDPAQQLACWAQRAHALLPGSSELLSSDFHICISKDSSGCSEDNSGSSVEIQLAWSVKNKQCLDSSTDGVCHYTLRSQL